MIAPKSSFKKIAVAAAFAGDSKKARPVIIYDLAGKSLLADYAVLMAVESAPQLDAVEEEVRVRLKQEGICCLHRDGMRSKNWKVLDYGGVLVHIYDGKAAGFYAIDKIYEGFRAVEWEKKPEPKPAAPAVKTVRGKEVPAKITIAKKPAVKKKSAKKTAKKYVTRKKTAKQARLAKKTAKAKKSKPVKKPAKKTSNKQWPSAGHNPVIRRLRGQ